MIPWQQITFVGDSVLTMPAAAAIVIWLLAGGAGRMAWSWCLLFGSGIFLVVATKIAFIGWGIGIPGLDFTGISGHAMRACAILPVIAVLLLQQLRPAWRTAGVLMATALALMVSLSRLVLHYHSTSEVVAGVALGMLVAIAFIRGMEGQRGFQLQHWVVGLTMLGLVPSSYAEPAPTQQWMTTVALYLSGHERPYVRKSNGELARAASPTSTQ